MFFPAWVESIGGFKMAKGKRGNWWDKRNNFNCWEVRPKIKSVQEPFRKSQDSGREKSHRDEFFEFCNRGFPTKLNLDPETGCSEAPAKVYRYFKSAEHADSFAAGEIYLSTMETCRRYEDANQGDKHEGREVFHIPGVINGNGDDPHMAAAAKMLGIHIEPGSVTNLTITNAVRSTSIEDAYLLCTTIGFSEKNLNQSFGRHCVEISNPEEFFKVLNQAVRRRLLVIDGQYGEVIYKERYFTPDSCRPGRIGFVKPPDQYAAQVEYRFLWIVPPGHRIKPEVISAPETRIYCRRIA